MSIKTGEFQEYCVQKDLFDKEKQISEIFKPQLFKNESEITIKSLTGVESNLKNFSILFPIQFPKNYDDFLRKGVLIREFKHLMQSLQIMFDFDSLCIKTQTIKCFINKDNYEKIAEKIKEYGFIVVFAN